MEEPVLSDAELAHKAQAQEWGEFYPGDAAIDFAIPARWRAELRQGRQLGKPLGPEEDIPDVPGARSQAFQFGRIYYRDGRTTLIA